MGYYYTTSAETAVPGKSWGMPKTHVPGSRVKERGHRFYSSELSRWVSRDPLGEQAFLSAFIEKRPRQQRLRIVAHSYFSLYTILLNRPIGAWDYLGLDDPGCNIPGFDPRPGDRLHNCMLRCCAQHDQCYYTRDGRAPDGGKRCDAYTWPLIVIPCSPCGN